MDLKSLIAKMDQIESKKFLTESEKKETSWTDMKGNKHSATKVKGKSYGNQPEPKEVDHEGKPKSKKVKEGLGIADSLLESFGLSEQVANPYTGADAQKFASLTPQDQAWLTKGGGKPDINDPAVLARAPNKGQQPAPGQSAQPTPAPAAGGEFKFSPEQEKWLGGANRQDPNIIARMPGPKPPLSYFKDPADQAKAKELNIGQDNLNRLKGLAGVNPDTSQKFADQPAPADDRNEMDKASDAAAAANPTNPSSANAVNGSDLQSDQAAAAKPAAPNIDPKKVERFKALLAKAGTPAKPAAQQSGQPVPGQTTQPTPAPASGKPAAGAQPAAGGNSYQIKPGDTLGKIASANGTTVQAIMAANPQIKDPNKISSGAKLNLPGKAQQSAQPAAKPRAGAAGMMGDIDPNTGMPSNPMPESMQISRLRSILESLDQPKQLDEVVPALAMAGGRAVAPYAARAATGLAGKAKQAWNAMRGSGGSTKYVPQSAVTKAAVGSAAATMGAQYAADKLAGAAEPAVAPATDQSSAETARLARQNAVAAPKPQQSAQPARAAAPAAAAPAAAPASLSSQEEGEMGTLAQELSQFMGQDPALDALLLQYEKMRPGAANAQP